VVLREEESGQEMRREASSRPAKNGGVDSDASLNVQRKKLLAVSEKLCQQLLDAPTSAGPTPNQLRASDQGMITIIPVEQVGLR
jgi:hypothetical protein